MKKEIEKTLLDICLKIAKNGKGCIIVSLSNPIIYEPFIPQDISIFPILGNERRLEALASIDGACIINQEGIVIGYGMNIKGIQTYSGMGSRHSAAYTASLPGNKVYTTSEEDRKVRVWHYGKIIMQLDSLEKGIETKTADAVNILESIGFGTVSSIGVSLLAPAALATAGISVLPGILIFGVGHYISKQLLSLIHRS